MKCPLSPATNVVKYYIRFISTTKRSEVSTSYSGAGLKNVLCLWQKYILRRKHQLCRGCIIIWQFLFSFLSPKEVLLYVDRHLPFGWDVLLPSMRDTKHSQYLLRATFSLLCSIKSSPSGNIWTLIINLLLQEMSS